MRIAVAGGDARFAYLTKLLRERNYDVRGVFLEQAGLEGVPIGDARWLAAADFVICGWPVRFPLSEIKPCFEDFPGLCGGKLILCGPKPFDNEQHQARVVLDLSAREEFLQENAFLTAEGAVHAAMSALDRILCGSVCVVVGYGRIGKSLAKRLRAMGALVTVATRAPARVERDGFHGVPTHDFLPALPLCDVLFSTPPHRVVDQNALAALPGHALVIDLASPPYGFDLDAAAIAGIRAWRESGLPGRYCPLSAAQVLLSFVEEVLKHGD